MASVQWYRFDYLDNQPGGFQPGQTRTRELDWPGGQWFGKAVVVTAQPFDASNQDRSLTVTEVRPVAQLLTELGFFARRICALKTTEGTRAFHLLPELD